MFNKLHVLLKKHREIVIYFVLGVLTTLTNYVVYFPLLNIFKLSATASNALAWAASVIVAFLTNKPLVFNSKDWSLKITMPEFIRFVGCRVASGLMETLILLLTVDVWHWNGNITKVIVGFGVIVANYITSKLFVFRK